MCVSVAEFAGRDADQTCGALADVAAVRGGVGLLSDDVVPGWRCPGGRKRVVGRRRRRQPPERQEPVQLAGQLRGGGRRPVPGVGQRRVPAGRHDRVLQGPRPVRARRLLRPGLVPAQRERARGPAAAGRRLRPGPFVAGVRVLLGAAAGRHRVGPAGEVRRAQGGTVPAVGRGRGARARRAHRGRTVLAPVHRRGVFWDWHARGQEGQRHQWVENYPTIKLPSVFRISCSGLVLVFLDIGKYFAMFRFQKISPNYLILIPFFLRTNKEGRTHVKITTLSENSFCLTCINIVQNFKLYQMYHD